MSLSVVIRCCNEAAHIGKLLEGLALQTVPHEVVVVDSGSTDDTVATAKRYDVNLVEIRKEDFTFGHALNVGCEAASGDTLVFASAHVYPVYTDWLERMAAPFEDPKVGAVYGKQRGGDTTKYSEHQIFAHWFPDDGPVRQDHPFCNNANCAVPRKLWKDHPYDEELTGLEDLAWAKEMSALGYEVVYAPEAEIIHVHDEPAHKVYRRYMREALALRHIYPEQSMSVLDLARLFLTNTASDYAHAAVEGQLADRNNVWEIPTFRFLQFLGAYRGLRVTGPISAELRRKFYYPRGLPRRKQTQGRDRAERIEYP